MQLQFTREELLSEHDIVSSQFESGRVMHGGFDSKGCYISPRSKGRCRAISNWSKALRNRGGDLLRADSRLLTGPRIPNVPQQCVLIRNGLDRIFWNNLTVVGKIEGRGRILAEMTFPSLSDLVVEDISSMAIGHLNEGLLFAHGLDEGGEPDKEIGGHDVMWFVARDLVFGVDRHPDIEPPERIARSEDGKRWMPQLDQPYEMMLSFLMNLLVIEFRAEIGFANTQAVLSDPDLFEDRRDEAAIAVSLVDRIRADEEIHVESLRLYLGELRSLTFRTKDGNTIDGKKIIDPFWQQLIQWATVEQPKLAAEQQYSAIRETILKHDNGHQILTEFDELRDAGYELVAG